MSTMDLASVGYCVSIIQQDVFAEVACIIMYGFDFELTPMCEMENTLILLCHNAFRHCCVVMEV